MSDGFMDRLAVAAQVEIESNNGKQFFHILVLSATSQAHSKWVSLVQLAPSYLAAMINVDSDVNAWPLQAMEPLGRRSAVKVDPL